MDNSPNATRPPFPQALKAWKQFLSQKGFSSDLLWVFDENLCFEPGPSEGADFRLGFQTDFTPPPADSEQIAYEHFCGVDAPLVWYRLGSNQGRSVCLLLCDPWFGAKTEAEGFTPQTQWHMLFRSGGARELEEIKDKHRWEKRLLRERPVEELNFCMTLRAVHETLAHGRVLTAYERYALKLLHVWRHWLGEPR